MGNNAVKESLVSYRMECRAGDDLAADQTRVLARKGGIGHGSLCGAGVFFVKVEGVVAQVEASGDPDRDAIGGIATRNLE